MSNVVPYLTIQDKINLAVLEGSTIPALIVEGTSDIKIYNRLLEKSKIVRHKYEFVVGTCKSEILKFYNNGLPFNYIAILDADYDRLNNCCYKDKRLIYTHYYTMENYLVTPEVIEAYLCEVDTLNSPRRMTAEMLLEQVRTSLKFYIMACLCKLEYSWSIKLEDCSIDRWFSKSKLCITKEEMIKYIIAELNNNLDESNGMQLLMKKQEIVEKYDLRELNIITNGKRKIEALFFILKNYYPEEMDGRNKKVLLGDLCKKIFFSPEANELLTIIDDRLSNMLLNSQHKTAII